MIKFTILLRRRQGMTHEDFVTYHENTHASLFMDLPEVVQNVRKYMQCHSLQVTLPGLPPPIYDGITELWFDDVDKIAAVFNSQNYLETIRPDEEKFLDLNGCSFLITTENLII